MPDRPETPPAASGGPASPRVRVRRHSERGRYDRETVEAILDEALICHIGVVVEGAPLVLPTLFGRCGDIVYLHGAPANRSLRAAGTGMCMSVSVVDGLVLARSTKMHSLNYRSVVIRGIGRPVTDLDERAAGLRAIVEHALPGRSREVREASPAEVAATAVVALDLHECSAKIRSGPPLDPEADWALPVWAGVVPLRLVAGVPLPDEHVDPEVPEPASVTSLLARFPGLPSSGANEPGVRSGVRSGVPSEVRPRVPS